MSSNNSPLKNLLISLKNVIGRLIRTHPLIFIVFIALIAFGLMMFTSSENKMTFILCVLISFVSLLIYGKNNNYAETVLSFMLGVLTIFTITWDNYTSKLFVGFYISINLLIFFITSIKLSMRVESKLNSAATYMDIDNYKKTYNELKKISNKNTSHNYLGGVEKAEVIKYLAYMKVPLIEIEDSIKNIEVIKVVFQLDLNKSNEFFKTLYFIKIRALSNFNITNLLDLTVHKRLPLLPEEFLTILNQTKKR